MRKKKDLPLAILKALESFVNLRGEKFEVVNPNNHLLKVIDKDSNFYFILEGHQMATGGRLQVLMNKRPKSQEDINPYRAWIEISELQKYFNMWLSLLDEYDKIDSFFDDPIIKSFAEDFFVEFEIIDEDADKKTFNTKQILLLDDYLDKIDNRLSEHKTEENTPQIEDIQHDIAILRESLVSKSKSWIVKNLSTIWAKIARQGTKFIKEFLTESKKEIIKQTVKGTIEVAKIAILN